MTLDSDALIDRRRLKRRLSTWRVLAILAIVAAIGFATVRTMDDGVGLGRSYIARVTVNGLITDSRARHDLLTKLKNDKAVKAVIVAVDSPGGTTSGGEALYEDLRALAEAKPVAAVFGTVAASAAYLGGIATDYIVARGNTITGSVGVIFQAAEVTDLLGKIGVKVEEIRSGKYKAKPSPFTPLDEDSRKISEELVKESQEWFVNLVLQRRKNASAIVDDVKTGRIYTGRQAAQNGLVDALGDEKTAIKWFTDVRQVPKGLKVVDRKTERGGPADFLQGAINQLAVRLGLASPLEAAIASQLEFWKDRPLNGLFSVWQP
jgi:protease-4